MVLARKVCNDKGMNSLSRRDLLKLGLTSLIIGAGATKFGKPIVDGLQNAATELRTGIDWQIDPWKVIDFVNRPDLVVDNPLAEKRMTNDLAAASDLVARYWTRMAEKYQDKSLMDIFNIEEHKQSNQELMKEVVEWAGHTDYARRNSLIDVLPESVAKYREIATYLSGFLQMYDHWKTIPEPELDAFFETFDWDEELSEVLKYQDQGDYLAPSVNRLDFHATWAFAWRDLINSGVGSRPILGHFIGYSDSGGISAEAGVSGEFLKRTPLNFIEKENVDGSFRPREVKIIDLDPNVSALLADKLRVFGLERAVATLQIDPSITAAFAYTRPVSGDLFLGSPLTLETYYKYQHLFDNNFFHEISHGIDARAFAGGNLGLPNAELLRYRDLQLQLIKRFDPLSDMKKIFNPDGGYLPLDMATTSDITAHFNEEIKNLNYITLTDYYFQSLENFHNHDYLGRNMWLYTDQLRKGLLSIASINMDEHLSLHPGDDKLDDIFSRLELEYGQMDVISAFVTKTILDNQENIRVRRRATFNDERTESEFFVRKVVPYTIMHIAMYKYDELIQVCDRLPNKQVISSFLYSWRTDLERFVRGDTLPNKEFFADIFAGAMTDNAGNIDWGNARDICMQMIALMRSNGLANIEEKTTKI